MVAGYDIELVLETDNVVETGDGEIDVELYCDEKVVFIGDRLAFSLLGWGACVVWIDSEAGADIGLADEVWVCGGFCEDCNWLDAT